MTMPGGPGPTVTTPDAVCNLLRSEASLDQADRERFYAVLVDVRQQIVGIDEVAIGDMTGVSVHPREAFRSAVLAGASAVIFAHNHPSGDPTPSDDDVNLTRHLATVGKVLGIPVLDHVVIGKSWPGRTSRPCTSLAQLRPKLFSVED
jgi:DNA repair protein RadC